jgi:hypothetical protein
MAEKSIRSRLEEEIQDNTIITGGHFMIKEDGEPELNKGTIDSFRLAAEVYKSTKENYQKVELGILINDIGATCSSDSCSINKINFSREDYRLPEEYLKILSELGIEETEVNIYWEKTMRNRGHKIMRREIKKGNKKIQIIKKDHYLYDMVGYGEIVLSRGNGKDPYGTAACPLIMAAYAMKQQDKKFTKSVNIYYIDYDNIKNIPNQFSIDRGKRVADLFGAKIEVKNIYFSEERMSVCFQGE